MHLKKLAVMLTGVVLLCASTGNGWADNGVAEIERTLGEGRAETIVVSQGTSVRLVLHAPAGVELHLHGYDLSGTAGEGAPVVMSFRADHTGRFPIEAHGQQDLLGRTASALAYLEVRPE